jgi:hypothetical protein
MIIVLLNTPDEEKTLSTADVCFGGLTVASAMSMTSSSRLPLP